MSRPIHLETYLQRVNMNMFSVVKPYACHHCDKSFSRRYNVRRHVENAHGDEESDTYEAGDDPKIEDIQSINSDDDSYPSSKKRRLDDLESKYDEIESEDDESEDDETSDSKDDETSDENESSSDLEDNATYQDWVQEATEATEEMWSEKYDKYVGEGMSEDQAKDKANRKTRWAVKRIFFNNYKDFLSSYLRLKENDTHQDILEDLEQKLDRGMGINKALNRVMPEHQSKFEGLFQQDE